MSDIKLGQILDDTFKDKRDAVHVAIVPMQAAEKLSPGDHVGFADPSDQTQVGESDKPFGIVDPYLEKHVKKGQWVYVCLYPNTVTSLRHQWTHPAFTEDAPMAKAASITLSDALLKAKNIIEAEASRAGLDYDEIMAGARDYVASGEYLSEGYRWDGHEMINAEAFWDAYHLLTGEKPKYPGSLFACSC